MRICHLCGVGGVYIVGRVGGRAGYGIIALRTRFRSLQTKRR